MTSTIQPAASETSQTPAVLPKKKSATAAAELRGERIRAELNIEKWPAIWNPTHSKSHTKLNVQSRTLERESTAPDGTKTISKVAINPIAQLGDLTTEDQRTLYALIKHWEDRGKPQQETPFSIRHMAKLLHKKGWGTNVIDAVTGSLERLRGTLLVWTRSYRSKDQRVEDLETVYVNILSKLKIVRRKIDGHVTVEAGYFQFDDHILKNLLSNYTKPFLFDVFIDIHGEIALKLYSYLDLIMADKNRFERRTKELFEDLGIKGASYRHPSKRKQNLEKAFAELTGLMLTTGVLRSATIERTKDEKDFKAVFQKVPRSQLSAEDLEPPIKFVTEEPVVINDYSKRKDPLIEQAEAAVRFFHRKIHGVEDHIPQSKEVSQALTLIGQYGVEKTHCIVEYAAAQAAETNFKIQHFGAILSYTSRALAAHSQKRTEQQLSPEPAAQSRPLPQERQTWKRGEARLAVLTADQYQVRFEEAKTRLFGENPSMAALMKTGSKVLESTVRARVLRDLDGEPMDLILLPSALSAMCQWHRPSQNLPL